MLHYLDVLERREVELLDQVVDEHVVVHGPGGSPGLEGLDAFKREQAGSPFSEERIEVDDLLVAGDKVVLRYRLECTHSGEFLGVPPSGRRLRASGIKIYRLANGKIAEIWGEDDLYGLLEQLRLVPPLAELRSEGADV